MLCRLHTLAWGSGPLFPALQAGCHASRTPRQSAQPQPPAHAQGCRRELRQQPAERAGAAGALGSRSEQVRECKYVHHRALGRTQTPPCRPLPPACALPAPTRMPIRACTVSRHVHRGQRQQPPPQLPLPPPPPPTPPPCPPALQRPSLPPTPSQQQQQQQAATMPTKRGAVLKKMKYYLSLVRPRPRRSAYPTAATGQPISPYVRAAAACPPCLPLPAGPLRRRHQRGPRPRRRGCRRCLCSPLPPPLFPPAEVHPLSPPPTSLCLQYPPENILPHKKLNASARAVRPACCHLAPPGLRSAGAAGCSCGAALQMWPRLPALQAAGWLEGATAAGGGASA